MSADRARGTSSDPVIELYKKDVDRTLLREHLNLTPDQRPAKLMAFMRSLEALKASAQRS